MAIYRSVMGKTVDMAALVARNSTTRAVGNMKNVNARGDTIDSNGNIIKRANEKVNEQYAKTVGSRSAQIRPADKVPTRTVTPTHPSLPAEELTLAELELESGAEEDIIVEQIKQTETAPKKGKK